MQFMIEITMPGDESKKFKLDNILCDRFEGYTQSFIENKKYQIVNMMKTGSKVIITTVYVDSYVEEVTYTKQQFIDRFRAYSASIYHEYAE
jgi:hypothetical protein